MAEIEIVSDLNELPRLVEFMERFVESEGISGPVVMRLNVVVEELVTNVIHHGYGGSDGHVRLVLERRGDRVHLVVSDRAPPFDPFETGAPDLDATAEDRPIGGLGVHLIRQFAEECVYERRGEENRVRISMRI